MTGVLTYILDSHNFVNTARRVTNCVLLESASKILSACTNTWTPSPAQGSVTMPRSWNNPNYRDIETFCPDDSVQ